MISSTSYFNIEKTYFSQNSSQNSPIYVKGPISLGNTTTNNINYQTQLTDQNIQNIICDLTTTGDLRNNPDCINLFLTSPDIQQSISPNTTFCGIYCGYHGYFSCGSQTRFYAFVGNPDRCPSSCNPVNMNASPNNNTGADGIINVLTHELMETISNPLLNAWFDCQGYENADKW
ncbi:unnamed protein product [Rotaria sp. Silwood2]|nr:unnamed protein product [Rotaria sp. Silwood2]